MIPLRAFVAESGIHGDWPGHVRSFLEIYPENVYLAGFKASEDGDGIILRLYEGAGLQSAARFTLIYPGGRSLPQ
ncbi:MAG: glycosyl hydrolase-related protein [Sulfobacillus sp.]